MPVMTDTRVRFAATYDSAVSRFTIGAAADGHVGPSIDPSNAKVYHAIIEKSDGSWEHITGYQASPDDGTWWPLDFISSSTGSSLSYSDGDVVDIYYILPPTALDTYGDYQPDPDVTAVEGQKHFDTDERNAYANPVYYLCIQSTSSDSVWLGTNGTMLEPSSGGG